MIDPAPPRPPEVNLIDLSDLKASLSLGWQDFRRAPMLGLVFSAVYVLGGWLIVWAMTAKGQVWWTLPASAGFPILGPFFACGFYEISRRLEAGEPLVAREVFAVIFRQKDRQIPAIAAVIVVYFLFWNFLSHMIFALFLGNATMTNVSTSLAVFLSPDGLTMLAFGTLVGAAFATLLYCLMVVSLPMLLDRDVDFVTAMLTSFALVRENPGIMLGWGFLIAVCLFAAMLPAFLGLLIALPLFGHASWHLYRRSIT
ncbi:MAG TPA: DUF2189 domain-containing protein [Tabrizicola sp.]|nr:DUF2189 domain-containing protein [Tabrizicola sp.]